MSRSQLNYVNDSTVGKRQVIGLIGLNNRVFEKVNQLDFEEIQLGSYAVLPAPLTGTEDVLGLGNNSECYYYTLTVISSANVYLYTATDEHGAGAANFDTITVSPFASASGNTSALDPNTGKLTLSAAGVAALGTKYLLGSYKYTISKAGWEIERRLVENAQYIFQSGVGAHQSHAIGVTDTDRDGNFRYDRDGHFADGTASRTGDIYVVRIGITEYNFVSFGANLDLFALDSGGSLYWKEINPIVESEDENMKYTKDASLYEGDVIALTVAGGGVVGQDITVNEVLVANEYTANFPYTMYVVQPALDIVLPIASNTGGAGSKITIKNGFVPPVTLNGNAIYIRKRKLGTYELKNSVR